MTIDNSKKIPVIRKFCALRVLSIVTRAVEVKDYPHEKKLYRYPEGNFPGGGSPLP
jgi:hypothetical protein